MFELYILVGLMILAAILAIEIRSLLSSVVILGVVGFLLCTVFLFLKAPDAALTQLIVEIIALVILIRATGVQQDDTERPETFTEKFAFGTVIMFFLVFAAFLLYALQGLPKFGAPSMTVSQAYIKEGFAKTGVPNLISAILLDFRSLDALGSITIFFGAILGAFTIMRRPGRKKVDERDDTDS
jgi:multisubunit Na+/H+ antiporter MnhB subunit